MVYMFREKCRKEEEEEEEEEEEDLGYLYFLRSPNNSYQIRNEAYKFSSEIGSQDINIRYFKWCEEDPRVLVGHIPGCSGGLRYRDPSDWCKTICLPNIYQTNLLQLMKCDWVNCPAEISHPLFD